MTTRFLLVALLAYAPLASADPGETAEAAAARGRAALKAGRIHEACDAFATSDGLAPSADTEVHLAACYAQDGKPASAARMYRSAADKDTSAARRKASLAQADKLEARAPRLHVTIRPAPPGLVLRVDGAEVPADQDALVDTGPHEVVATAPGYEGHASAPVDREGTTVQVIVQLDPIPETAPVAVAVPVPPTVARAPMREPTPTPTPTPPRDAPAPDHRTRNGIILGAAGLGVLAGAVIAYEAGSNKFDDAATLCPGDVCASDADLMKGHSLLSDGRTLRQVSIGMGIGSAVLLAAGGYLLMTGHHEEAHVAVQVDHTGAGIAYTARF
jgi:hypothetical protein